MKDKWIALGHHIDNGGDRHMVGIPVMDLMVHGSLYGTTGSGKTALLNNILLQLIAHRATVVVVTPHPEMITHPTEGLLSLAPRWVMNRVIHIDIASKRPPQFNIATSGLNRSQAVAVENGMNALRNLDPATWDGLTRSRRLLRQALTALVAVKGANASLVDLFSFMQDEKERDRIVKELPQSAFESRHYWEQFKQTVETSRDGGETMLAPARGRIDQFIIDDALKHSLAMPITHPDTLIDFEKALSSPGKIILITISKQSLGESARRVFGTFLMDTVIDVCMARQIYHPTVVVMDEMGDLAGVGDIDRLVSKAFAETRKYQLGCMFATQFPNQLPPALVKASQALTNLKIVLKLEGEAEAKMALPNLANPQLKPIDLMTVEKFHGYARTKVHGESQPTYYFKTLPPLDYSKMEGGKSHKNGVAYRSQPPEKFPELERLRTMSHESAVQYLTRLPREDFRDLLGCQVKANRELARMIGEEKSLIPDQVSATVQRSGRVHGLDRRWYEAHYRRMRGVGEEAPTAPSVVGSDKGLDPDDGAHA